MKLEQLEKQSELLAKIESDLDNLVNETPSGPYRNSLVDASIKVAKAQIVLHDYLSLDSTKAVLFDNAEITRQPLSLDEFYEDNGEEE